MIQLLPLSEKLPKVKKCQMCENSPNLVTLFVANPSILPANLMTSRHEKDPAL
jgi:hypothetical protein